jgi:hypothetical protein
MGMMKCMCVCVCVQVKVCVCACASRLLCTLHGFFLLRKCDCRQCVLFIYEGCSASIVCIGVYFLAVMCLT